MIKMLYTAITLQGLRRVPRLFFYLEIELNLKGVSGAHLTVTDMICLAHIKVRS